MLVTLLGILTFEIRFLLNAVMPIVVTLFGIITFVN
jgi:hypothetical protein